jgi:cysteine desulfurase
VAAAELEGMEVEVIPVQPTGDVSLAGDKELRAGRTLLVSMQWVNQETGLILPIPAIAERCGSAGIPLHVDAVQAAGKIPIRLDETPVDLMSLSGHKLGGPRSSGALIVAGDAEISPRIFGGGQEGGLRPGTEDVSGAVGFALALEISASTLEEETTRLTSLRRRLEAGLGQQIPGLRVHAVEGPRAPHISNFGIPGVARDVLVGALDLEGFGISAGSACRSGSTSTSPILRALYGPEAERFAPMRLSLGWSTTAEEVEEAIRNIPPIIERIRGST